ncbi:MAG: sugar ABC transporter permease [Candidatus Rokubacteria bacterium]|nr:sugar ABC transporter permease [Candidatus Rokubacteria bacterium]
MRARVGYWFVAPAALVLVAVLVLPVLHVFYESFVWSTSTRERVFPSLRNYEAIAADEIVRIAAGNTVTFTVASVAGHLLVGLGVALLLNQQIRGRAVFRNLALLPWMLPPAVVATGWAWLYHNPFGMLNPLLVGLGVLSAPRAWLATLDTAMGAVIVANLWRGFPFISLILLAGLQSIPVSLYEAASVDGASAWRCFRHVTLPGLKRVILIAATLDVINTVKYFDLIWVMTGGGPANRTEVFATLIYRVAFQFFRGGRAAALALLMVVAVAAFSFFYVRLTVRTAAETATA